MSEAAHTHAEWFAQVRGWGVLEVAARLGREPHRHGADVSFVCPVCAKELRHTKDGTGRRSAKATPDGGGWWCEPCQARGDAVAFAAAVVTGSTEPPRERWADVRRECAALGLCEADPRDTGARAPSVRYEPAPPRPAAPPPARLPAAEVAALWAACQRLDAVPPWEGAELNAEGSPGWCGAARRFLAGRGFDVGHLAAVDAARVVPPAAVLEHWPSWWGSGWGRSWRLAVPMYDAGGAMVAMQARAIDGTDTPKTRNPRGTGATAGTFFASPEGLELLRGSYAGPGLVLVEGLTDTMSAVCLVAELERHRRPAVLGLVAGSAKALGAVRVSTATRVNVLTDIDEDGEKYAEAARSALDRRVTRVRLKPIEGKRADLNNWLQRDPAAALAAVTHGMETT
jgi:hypothetical protein